MKGNVDKENALGKRIDEVFKIAKYVAMYTHVYTPEEHVAMYTRSYLLHVFK